MGSPSILTSPIFNIGFLLVSMQLAKKIDWEDPQVVTYARISYYGAQLLVVGLAYGLMLIVKKKNDTTTLVYDAPQKPGSTEAPTSVTTTVREYDLDQLQQFIKSTVTSIAVISVMHFQFKFTQPLFMQTITPIKNFIVHKETLIHLWGDAAEGSLARPFVAENPFAALTGFLNSDSMTPPSTASATTTEAEHAHKD